MVFSTGIELYSTIGASRRTLFIRLISEKFGVAKVKISELRVYLISGYPPLGWGGLFGKSQK